MGVWLLNSLSALMVENEAEVSRMTSRAPPLSPSLSFFDSPDLFLDFSHSVSLLPHL